MVLLLMLLAMIVLVSINVPIAICPGNSRYRCHGRLPMGRAYLLTCR